MMLREVPYSQPFVFNNVVYCQVIRPKKPLLKEFVIVCREFRGQSDWFDAESDLEVKPYLMIKQSKGEK